jgi:hypothetical protein
MIVWIYTNEELTVAQTEQYFIPCGSGDAYLALANAAVVGTGADAYCCYGYFVTGMTILPDDFEFSDE